MTWDVLLLKVRSAITAAAELDEAAVIPMGSPAEVRAAIARACPAVRLTDATSGELVSADYRIAISLGDDDPVRGVLLRVAGNEEHAANAIGALCAAQNWRALDMNTEEFIEVL